MEVINTTGRRKTSVARIYLKAGSGKITVNKREFEDYFPTEVSRTIVNQPFDETGQTGNFDVTVTLHGGGPASQAGALRLAISRALLQVDPEHRPPLKAQGFLTRDSRMVERKKYGRRKARRRFQFSKR